MKRSTLIIAALLLLASCTQDTKTTVVTTGKKIPTEEHKKIEEKIDEIFKALSTDNPDLIKRMFPTSVVGDDLNVIDSIAKYVDPNRDRLRSYPVAEFLVTHNDKLAVTSVSSELSLYSYMYHFTPVSPEMYIYLLAIPDSSGNNELLLSTAWGKVKDDWILSDMQLGNYMTDRKIAPHWYEVALRYYNAGRIVPARYYLARIAQTIAPAGENFEYLHLSQITSFGKDVVAEYDSLVQLPRTVNTIATKPILVSVFPDRRLAGYTAPVIEYQTHLSLSDVNAITSENMKLRAEIDSLLPRIHDLSDTIIYRVFYIKDSVNHLELKEVKPIER